MKRHNLVLRPFTSRDICAYHEMTRSADIARYIPNVIAKKSTQTLDLIYKFQDVNFKTDFAFIIEVTSESGVSCPVGALFASLEPCMNSLNVSYFIGNRHRKMGYMTEALQKFIAYCKHETPFYSLVFDDAPQNAISKRLIISLGGTTMGESPISIFETFERLEIRL